MLVEKRMTHPVITVPAETPIVEAMNLMKREHIHRLPIIENGNLIGIVSDKEIMNATPSAATSLSVWELNYLISKLTVKDIMAKKLFTVKVDDSIEKAARIMADNRVGGLPVLREGEVVGIITETDVFKTFIELMGAREKGIQVTALISDAVGTWAKITQVVSEAGGNFIAIGQFARETPHDRWVVFKVAGIPLEKMQSVIEPVVIKIESIRESVVD
jgi:acetoin utilization protein AcuB